MKRSILQPPRHYNPMPRFGLRHWTAIWKAGPARIGPLFFTAAAGDLMRSGDYAAWPLGMLDGLLARRGAFDINDPDRPIDWLNESE